MKRQSVMQYLIEANQSQEVVSTYPNMHAAIGALLAETNNAYAPYAVSENQGIDEGWPYDERITLAPYEDAEPVAWYRIEVDSGFIGAIVTWQGVSGSHAYTIHETK